ncbi:uncharacterized protein [Centruroides vittatus]|uniref:uncharacterized protein n=1 Tax=Centruroides vittatus TaxID=120091 RepID=UPI00350FC657
MANGLVENSHRRLKSAFKACLTDRWTEVLPSVLLGMRAAFKEDIKATTAELVYGTPLRLPGKFLAPTPSDSNAAVFVQQLKEQMHQLTPTPTRCNGTKKIFVPQDLQRCTHVFVRHDAVRPPLQLPFDGPFPVLQHADKFFKVRVWQKETVISIDRLILRSHTIHDSLRSRFAYNLDCDCRQSNVVPFAQVTRLRITRLL